MGENNRPASKGISPDNLHSCRLISHSPILFSFGDIYRINIVPFFGKRIFFQKTKQKHSIYSFIRVLAIENKL
jgi:hypothetical protein